MTEENKVVLIGEACVGKTSLVSRLISRRVNEREEMTIGASYACHKHNDIRLNIWDAAGQRRFDSFLDLFLKNACVILVCFDVFEDNVVNGYIHRAGNVSPKAEVILVKTKIDMLHPDAVDKHAEYFALSQDAKFFYTSALENRGVKELFDYVASRLGGADPNSVSASSVNNGGKRGRSRSVTIEDGVVNYIPVKDDDCCVIL